MADITAVIDDADRRLFEATKGAPAVHTAARVIAALRAVIAGHEPTRFVPQGGNDPTRCAVCGGDPGDGNHPADEEAIKFGGYYLCQYRTTDLVCELCYQHDRREYEYQGWPCGPVAAALAALTKDA
ncbi:hypothetical protein [Nocardiopsis synnemataformans]|uniref:hypothetical protein n=1 Tax=Nocardiopsis synnemataformans TaxID=61305 RepID=UPI003EBD6849